MKKETELFLEDKMGGGPSGTCKKSSWEVSRKRSIVLLSLALIVITLAVYWQVGTHGFLNYDDNLYITENDHVKTGVTGSNIIWAFTSVHAANWHPVTWLSHMADIEVYGMNPRGHHLTNVVVHSVSTVLLFLLFFRLTSALWQSSFVAALFALHPLHVESVAWVAERKDVLCAFFWFLTLLLYAEYVAKRERKLYLLSLFAFVLGLMSKTMLVTLPLVMLLLDFWPLNRYNFKEREAWQPLVFGPASRLTALVKEKIPFIACSILSSAITIYAQHRGSTIHNFNDLPFWLRIENAAVSYVKYIAKTFWPHDLAVFYPIPRLFLFWQFICSLFVLLLISATTIWARRRHPYLAVGWFWFLITLVPVIGLVQVGSQSMADRYSYLPSIGLFIMAAWGISALAKDLQYRKVTLALLACAVIVSSAVLTWQQLVYWRDDVSLFRHALHVTTGNYVMHNTLGAVYVKKEKLDAAIREFQEALTINPDFPDAHNNLGIALAMKGNLDAAIREFQIALKINPDFSDAHHNLGIVLTQKRMHDEARHNFN